MPNTTVEGAVTALERAQVGGYALPVCLAQRGQAAVGTGDRAMGELDLKRAIELARAMGLSSPTAEAQVEIARLRALLGVAAAGQTG